MTLRLSPVINELQFKDELVKKTCYINQNIDTTVLIEDRIEGREFMKTSPSKVKVTLVMHDTKQGYGFRLGTTSSGGDFSTPITRWPYQPRMKTDVDYQIK
jgi:hypothetical protein